MGTQNRRRGSRQRKLQIVLDSLQSDRKVPEICQSPFADLDNDDDVDNADFLTFLNCMNGSLNPPDLGCPISRPNECGGQSATGGDARVVGRRGGRPARRSQVFGR